jgi:hypothetical protein
MYVTHKRLKRKVDTYLCCSRCGLVLAVVVGKHDVYFPNAHGEPGLCQECAIEEWADRELQNESEPV